MRTINAILAKLRVLKANSTSIEGYSIKAVTEFASRHELDGVAPIIIYCDFEGFRIEFKQEGGLSRGDNDTLHVKAILNNSSDITKEKRLADIQLIINSFKEKVLKAEFEKAEFTTLTK